jgi:hypothetical protein
MVTQSQSLQDIGALARQSAAIAGKDKVKAAEQLLARLRSAPRLMTALSVWILDDVQNNPISVFAPKAKAVASEDTSSIGGRGQTICGTQNWLAPTSDTQTGVKAPVDGMAQPFVGTQKEDGHPVNPIPIGGRGHSGVGAQFHTAPTSDTQAGVKASVDGMAQSLPGTLGVAGHPVNPTPIGGRGHSENGTQRSFAPTSDTQTGVKAPVDGMAQRIADTQVSVGYPVNPLPIGGKSHLASGAQEAPALTSESTARNLVATDAYVRRPPKQPDAPPTVNVTGYVQERQVKATKAPYVHPPHKPMDLGSQGRLQEVIAKSFMDSLLIDGKPVAKMTGSDMRNLAIRSDRYKRFADLMGHGVPDSMEMAKAHTEAESKTMWEIACRESAAPDTKSNTSQGLVDTSLANQGVAGHA